MGGNIHIYTVKYISIYVQYISVCIDIKVTTAGEDMSNMNLRWSLGPCSSGNSDFKYKLHGHSIERCCLVPGIHTLTCYTSDQSLGWKDAKIEIQGHSYCDDFIDFKAFRKIEIAGK